MAASWHVVAKLLTVSRMSKVDYQNKVLLCILLKMWKYLEAVFTTDLYFKHLTNKLLKTPFILGQ